MYDGAPSRKLKLPPEQERRDSEYNRVPLFSEADPQEHVAYPDWTPENTRIITVGIGREGRKYKSNHFAESNELARRMVREQYGRIVEENVHHGRGFYRVYREQK